MNNDNKLEQTNRQPERLTAERRGPSGTERLDWVNRVRVDDQEIKFTVLPLNTLGTVMLEATKKIIKNREEEVVVELRKEIPELSDEEIYARAREEVAKTKEELLSLPGLMTFLERNKDRIQEIALDGGISYADGRSDSAETYFGGKGIPLGAEHYFLTTIKDRGQLTELMQTNKLSAGHQYTVREFYTSSMSDGPKRALGFKVFEVGRESDPNMVFIFATDVSESGSGASDAANTDKEVEPTAESINQNNEVANDNVEVDQSLRPAA